MVYMINLMQMPNARESLVGTPDGINLSEVHVVAYARANFYLLPEWDELDRMEHVFVPC